MRERPSDEAGRRSGELENWEIWVLRGRVWAAVAPSARVGRTRAAAVASPMARRRASRVPRGTRLRRVLLGPLDCTFLVAVLGTIDQATREDAFFAPCPPASRVFSSTTDITSAVEAASMTRLAWWTSAFGIGPKPRSG